MGIFSNFKQAVCSTRTRHSKTVSVLVVCLLASLLVVGPSGQQNADAAPSGRDPVACEQIRAAFADFSPNISVAVDGCDSFGTASSQGVTAIAGAQAEALAITIDCENPGPDVQVHSPETFVNGATFGAGVHALRPGVYDVDEHWTDATLLGDVTITSCDPTQRAVFEAAAVSGTSAILSYTSTQPRTVTITDVDFRVLISRPAMINVSGMIDLVIERSSFTGSGIDVGIEVSSLATATFRQVSITETQIGIRARQTGPITIDAVDISRSRTYAIRVEGNIGARPPVDLTNVTITDTGLAGSDGSAIYATGVQLTINQATITCSRNADVLVRGIADVAFVTEAVLANLDLGSAPVGAPCELPQRFGVFSVDNVDLAIRDSVVANKAVGVSFGAIDQATYPTSGSKVVDRVTMQNNDVGLRTYQDLSLSGSSLVDNETQCVVIGAAITADGSNFFGPQDRRASCFASCDAAPDGALIVSPHSVPQGGLSGPGIVALHSGDYRMASGWAASDISGGVTLIACDPANRPLLISDAATILDFRHTGGGRVAVSITDIDFLVQAGSSGGALAMGLGIELTLERSSIDSTASSGKDAVVLGRGTRALIKDVQIVGGRMGVQSYASSVVTIINTEVSNTVTNGVSIQGETPGQITDFQPYVQIQNLTVFNAGESDIGHGLRLGNGLFEVADTTISCSFGANVVVFSSGLTPDQRLEVENLQIGVDIPAGGCDHPEAGGRQIGLWTRNGVPMKVDGGVVSGRLMGVVIEGPGGPHELSNLTIQNTGTALTTGAPVDLTAITFANNTVDCELLDGGAIVDLGGNSTSDGTCLQSLELVPGQFDLHWAFNEQQMVRLLEVMTRFVQSGSRCSRRCLSPRTPLLSGRPWGPMSFPTRVLCQLQQMTLWRHRARW